jgi:hypothetical protein
MVDVRDDREVADIPHGIRRHGEVRGGLCRRQE